MEDGRRTTDRRRTPGRCAIVIATTWNQPPIVSRALLTHTQTLPEVVVVIAEGLRRPDPACPPRRCSFLRSFLLSLPPAANSPNNAARGPTQSPHKSPTISSHLCALRTRRNGRRTPPPRTPTRRALTCASTRDVDEPLSSPRRRLHTRDCPRLSKCGATLTRAQRRPRRERRGKRG